MRRKSFLIFVCFAVFSIFAGNAVTLAKEKPVEGVWQMFDTFNQLEAQFRNDKWPEAAAMANKIDSDYKKLVATLRNTVDGNTIQKFGFLIASVQKKIEAKDAEGIEKPYNLLQGLFLDIMSFYDYPNPPVLLLAFRYVDEAKEALGRNDIRDVGEEMEEILSFKPRLIEGLKEKGVANPEGVVAKVEAAQKAAKDKNKDEVAKLLADLEGVLAPFKM